MRSRLVDGLNLWDAGETEGARGFGIISVPVADTTVSIVGAG